MVIPWHSLVSVPRWNPTGTLEATCFRPQIQDERKTETKTWDLYREDQSWYFMILFPNSNTAGFQSLGLGVWGRFCRPLKLERNPGSLEAWNLLLGCKAGRIVSLWMGLGIIKLINWTNRSIGIFDGDATNNTTWASPPETGDWNHIRAAQTAKWNAISQLSMFDCQAASSISVTKPIWVCLKMGYAHKIAVFIGQTI